MEPPLETETTSLPGELDIHQLSLQMFMGKTQYQKYLAKSNPQSFRETQRKHTQYLQHETQIRAIMNDMLRAYIHPDTYTMPTTLDTNMVDAFTTFVDKAVFHYEKLRATQENQLPIAEEDVYAEDCKDEDDTLFVTPSTSSWGKPVRKLPTTPRPITNTLDYFMKPVNK